MLQHTAIAYVVAASSILSTQHLLPGSNFRAQALEGREARDAIFGDFVVTIRYHCAHVRWFSSFCVAVVAAHISSTLGVCGGVMRKSAHASI